MSTSVESLKVKCNEGYINLSKWLIGLSTGTIVFSIKLIQPGIPEYLGMVLVWGLICLVLSIVAGVVSVRLRLDSLGYNIMVLLNKSELAKAETHNRVTTSKMKALQATIKKQEKAFDIRNIVAVAFFALHQWTFFLGIALAATFGILSIQL